MVGLSVAVMERNIYGFEKVLIGDHSRSRKLLGIFSEEEGLKQYGSCG